VKVDKHSERLACADRLEAPARTSLGESFIDRLDRQAERQQSGCGQ